MTIWRMRVAFWIPKATNTHSAYVILIAFPQQQWLQERASILNYTYIACSVVTCVQLIGHQSCQSLIYLWLISRRYPELRIGFIMAG